MLGASRFPPCATHSLNYRQARRSVPARLAPIGLSRMWWLIHASRMNAAIGPAQASDYEDLRPLINPRDPEPQARELFVQLLSDERWAIVAAYKDNRAIGYAAAQDYGPHLRHGNFHRTVRLHDLIIVESLRRQGVGTRLLSAAIDWARSRAARYIEWQAHESRAAPFYIKLGYTGVACPQPDYPTFEVDLRPELQ